MRTHHDIGGNSSTGLGRFSRQRGKVGWLFLWLIGIPVPVLVILFLIRGCT